MEYKLKENHNTSTIKKRGRKPKPKTENLQDGEIMAWGQYRRKTVK